MSTETNQNSAESNQNGGDGGGEAKAETVSIPKSEYETLNQTLGSLKRQVKDLTKSKDESKETPEKTKPEEFGLLQKTYLRAAGVVADDEVELARAIQKRTGLEWDVLVDDDYFKTRLEGLRTAKANTNAVSNIKGSPGVGGAKDTPEYWIAKGIPPTRAEVSDRKVRAKIARAMMDSAQNTKKFYNE